MGRTVFKSELLYCPLIPPVCIVILRQFSSLKLTITTLSTRDPRTPLPPPPSLPPSGLFARFPISFVVLYNIPRLLPISSGFIYYFFLLLLLLPSTNPSPLFSEKGDSKRRKRRRKRRVHLQFPRIWIAQGGDQAKHSTLGSAKKIHSVLDNDFQKVVLSWMLN